MGLILFAATLGGVGCSSSSDAVGTSSTSAVTQSGFDKNDVLDDASLVASDAMSADDIQRFLEKTPYGGRSGLADYTTDTGERVSDVLARESSDNGINPLAMLVRLQMEEGLINRADVPQTRIEIAFGCGCESASSCAEKYIGFANQAHCMASTLRRDMEALGAGGATVSGWQRGRSKKTEDGVSVTPATNATAALYTYTPWVGEAGGGAAGVGGASLHQAIWKKFATAVGFGSGSTAQTSNGNGTGGCAADDPSCAQDPSAGDPSAPTPTPTPSTSRCTPDDCSGSTPVCDTLSGKCVPCRADFDTQNPAPLACPSADAPACATSGPNKGACVECSASNTSACDESVDTPVCITSAGACGCSADTDCGDAQYCDTTQGHGVCTDGCRVQNGSDTCPMGQACSAQNGRIGTCQGDTCAQTGCNTAPNLVCDTTSATPSCVQCLADSDCGGGKVCDTRAKKCVECTAQNKKACSAQAKGSACLANETCGCAADSDCGGPTSGRVCDTTANACVVGCRDSGGNGCPNGQFCSSGDKAIGTCKTESGGNGSGPSAPPSGNGGTAGSGSSGSSGTYGGTPLGTGKPDGTPHVPSKGNQGNAASADTSAPATQAGGKGCSIGAPGGAESPSGALAALGLALGAVIARRRRVTAR